MKIPPNSIPLFLTTLIILLSACGVAPVHQAAAPASAETITPPTLTPVPPTTTPLPTPTPTPVPPPVSELETMIMAELYPAPDAGPTDEADEADDAPRPEDDDGE